MHYLSFKHLKSMSDLLPKLFSPHSAAIPIPSYKHTHASTWLNNLDFQDSLGFLIFPFFAYGRYALSPVYLLCLWLVRQVDLLLKDASGMSSHDTSSRKTSLIATTPQGRLSAFFYFLGTVITRLIPWQYCDFYLPVSLSKLASPWRQALCFSHLFVLSMQHNILEYNVYLILNEENGKIPHKNLLQKLQSLYERAFISLREKLFLLLSRHMFLLLAQLQQVWFLQNP